MVRVRRSLARGLVRGLARGVVLLTAVPVVVLSSSALSPAMAVTSHRALNDTRPVVAGVVEVDFPIEYFGLVGDLVDATHRPDGHGPSTYGQARFRVAGAWTPWRDLDQDGAQQAGHFTGALTDVDHADAYQVRQLPAGVRNWRAAAINTTDGPGFTVTHVRADAASAAAPCRSRADWGADESISGWSRGDTQTFYPVQVMTVHHTAGSNDTTQNYAATVRAIYSYHVTTNGWSDIGYQYLVSGRGVVFEGRNSGHTSQSCLYAGGDGSDFAHQTSTDRLVTGAHVAGYNSGNLGIALMGCYEPTSACSGDTTPPSAAVSALETLLAGLATRHSLRPQGTVTYVNPSNGNTRVVNTISGHRDWDATACPGGRLYALLPTIRSDVAGLMASPPSAPASLGATALVDTVTLTWTAPTSDGGAAISRYELFRSNTSPVSTATTPVYSGTALTTTNKPATGTYYYAVRACNVSGCGPTTSAGPVSVVVPASITSGSCSGATCSFAGRGTGTLAWTFGNGASATGSSVTTTYTSAASYVVRLTDALGSSTTRAVQCSTVKGKLRCTT